MADMMSSPPSQEEIDEYCRDDQSVGCDVEMLEKMLKDARRREIQDRKSKRTKPVWNADIDEAVEATTADFW